jgi:hypothetical protein
VSISQELEEQQEAALLILRTRPYPPPLIVSPQVEKNKVKLLQDLKGINAFADLFSGENKDSENNNEKDILSPKHIILDALLPQLIPAKSITSSPECDVNVIDVMEHILCTIIATSEDLICTAVVVDDSSTIGKVYLLFAFAFVFYVINCYMWCQSNEQAGNNNEMHMELSLEHSNNNKKVSKKSVFFVIMSICASILVLVCK